MIRAVVFDNDGTIYDNSAVAEGVRKGIKRAYSELGIKAKIPNKTEIIRRTGMPNPDFFYGIIPEKGFERTYRKVYKYQIEEVIKIVRAKKGKMFQGAKNTFKKLKGMGIKIAVITNGEKDYIRAVAKTHGYGKYFAIIMSVEEINGDKGDLLKKTINILLLK